MRLEKKYFFCFIKRIYDGETKVKVNNSLEISAVLHSIGPDNRMNSSCLFSMKKLSFYSKR